MGAMLSGAERLRYTRVAISLHWAIAALIVANLLIGLLMDDLPDGIVPIHKSIGMLVLLLSIVRLAWRIGHRPPPLPASLKRWEVRLAHGVHWLFYALMVLIPLSGWIFTSASLKRHPLTFFGLFDLPYFPVPQSKPIAHVWAERHELLAYAMVGLLALHVVAALKHRFADGDRTMDRMLPGAGPR